MVEEAAWRRRFRATRTTLPQWAEDAPDRLVFNSNESGTWELYAWDRTSDERRQLTRRREGTISGAIDPTGEHVWWFDDTDGDEFGSWVRQPFDGDKRTTVLEKLGRAYDAGLNLGRALAVIGRSVNESTSLYLDSGDSEPRLLYQHAEQAYAGGLSAAQDLICIAHSEHGDARHPALRVVDLKGTTVGDLWDGPGLGLESRGFPHINGDERVLVIHERDDLKRPLIWSPTTGKTQVPKVDLPGDVEASWYPDGKSVLLVHEHAGRSQLYRLDLDTEKLVQIPTQSGTIADAAARPDGEVWYMWSDAATASEIRCAGADGSDRGILLRPSTDAAPAGVKYTGLVGRRRARPRGGTRHQRASAADHLLHSWRTGVARSRHVRSSGPVVGRSRAGRGAGQLSRLDRLWQGMARCSDGQSGPH